MTRCSSILTNPHKFPMAVSRISHHPLGPVIRRDVCVELSRLLTVTFTTAAFRTEAAYGCLKPAPASRLRRAFLHLRHSTVFSEHVLGTKNPENRREILADDKLEAVFGKK